MAREGPSDQDLFHGGEATGYLTRGSCPKAPRNNLRLGKRSRKVTRADLRLRPNSRKVSSVGELGCGSEREGDRLVLQKEAER